jgi:hypothetical protein
MNMIKQFFSTHAKPIRHWLASGKLPGVLAGVAIVLTLQSVGTGLQFDDYFQREILLGLEDWPVEDASLTGMFSFVNGDPERTKLGMRSEVFPWWTFEGIRLAFFRPLTEITHWLDYRLWPDSQALMHAHSLLWFGIMILAAAVLYRKLMEPPWVAGLAAFFYAIDDAHGVPAGWLANRNALIAAVFGIITLIVHDRWRRNGWKAGFIVGPACLLLGLFSAEAALTTGVYLLAYEICLVQGGLRRKIAGLFPYAIVAIPWWVLYRRLGFGTWGSGAYLDPGQEPLLFLQALVERTPILLLGQWLLPNAVIYGLLPRPLAHLMWIGAIVLLAAIIVLLIPLLKRDAIARFWALGMVLAVFPICATFPNNRLLLSVGLGAMGLLAQFLASWFDQAAWLPDSRLWRGLARIFIFLFVVIHGLLAPLMLPATSTGTARLEKIAAEKPLMHLPDENDIAWKTVVFVNPPVSFFVMHTPTIRREYDRPLPAHIHILASGMTPQLEITRVDEYSLELQPDGGFIAIDFDKLFRGPAHPMQVGQRVELGSDMSVEVLSLTEGWRPLRARFTFTLPLDDPSFLFLVWKDQDFVRFELPAIGESVQLSQTPFPL